MLETILKMRNLGPETTMTVRHRVKCPKTSDVKIIDRQYAYSSHGWLDGRLTVTVTDERKSVTVWGNHVIAIDGMALTRYAALWGIDKNGTVQKSGKKRGRPSKKRVEE